MYNIAFTRLSPVGSGAENEMHPGRGSEKWCEEEAGDGTRPTNTYVIAIGTAF